MSEKRTALQKALIIVAYHDCIGVGVGCDESKDNECPGFACDCAGEQFNQVIEVCKQYIKDHINEL